MSSINFSMRRLVEVHFTNFFGQCLNERTFVKRFRQSYLNLSILVIIWIVYLMKSVLVSTRCENLTISPVTTPYLDLIVSFESCYGKLGLSDSGAPATTMKSVFLYKVRLNCPCLMLMVLSKKITAVPSSPSISRGLSINASMFIQKWCWKNTIFPVSEDDTFLHVLVYFYWSRVAWFCVSNSTWPKRKQRPL